MKKLIPILFCLLPVMTLSAQESQRFDNTVIIRTTDSTDEAYVKLARLMVSQGFPIDHADREFMTISTRGKGAGNSLDPQGEVRVLAVIDKGETTTITLRGQSRMIDRQWWRLSNRGMATSTARLGWLEIESLARQYEGAEIEFLREEY